MISGYSRDIDDICSLLGCYAACSVKSLPTYRYQLQVSRNPKGFLFGLRCPETSVRNYYYTLSKNTDKRKPHDSLKVDSHKDGFSNAGNTSFNGKGTEDFLKKHVAGNALGLI